MSKHSKMYENSPKVSKDSEGKPGISKPDKATAESIGTEGNPLEGAGDGMPVDPHQAERAEMGKKHLQEHKDMNKRQEAEHESMTKRHHEAKLAGTPTPKKED
jgi:hypothetical protein